MRDKEEELEPRNPQTLASSTATSTVAGSKSQKEPQPPISQVPNAMNEPSRLKEENEKLFSAAHGERRAMNMERMKEYMQKRVQSFQERTKICDLLKSMFGEKQKNTRVFLKNIIRFFEDYIGLYTSLNKSIGKLELKKKIDSHTMYTAVKESISELIQLNDSESAHVQKFTDWMEKILVQALRSAEGYFKQRMKKINKDLEVTESSYVACWVKQQKNYEKLAEGNDLLEKQYVLVQNIKATNQAAVRRAVELNQAWIYLLEEQNTIKRLLKDNILQFHQRFVKFHKKTEAANAIFKYWSNLPLSAPATTVYASFLDEKSLEYINFGCKSKRIQDTFEAFMKMTHEEERSGDPVPFLDILVVKRYFSKLQISQREWKEIKLVFTVDSHLVVVDLKQNVVIMKLKQRSVKLKRISENILELSGLEEGVIFDSKKKQSVHFETIDEVEEFIYFVNSIPERKQEK